MHDLPLGLMLQAAVVSVPFFRPSVNGYKKNPSAEAEGFMAISLGGCCDIFGDPTGNMACRTIVLQPYSAHSLGINAASRLFARSYRASNLGALDPSWRTTIKPPAEAGGFIGDPTGNMAEPY